MDDILKDCDCGVCFDCCGDCPDCGDCKCDFDCFDCDCKCDNCLDGSNVIILCCCFSSTTNNQSTRPHRHSSDDCCCCYGRSSRPKLKKKKKKKKKKKRRGICFRIWCYCFLCCSKDGPSEESPPSTPSHHNKGQVTNNASASISDDRSGDGYRVTKPSPQPSAVAVSVSGQGMGKKPPPPPLPMHEREGPESYRKDDYEKKEKERKQREEIERRRKDEYERVRRERREEYSSRDKYKRDGRDEFESDYKYRHKKWNMDDSDDDDDDFGFKSKYGYGKKPYKYDKEFESGTRGYRGGRDDQKKYSKREEIDMGMKGYGRRDEKLIHGERYPKSEEDKQETKVMDTKHHEDNKAEKKKKQQDELETDINIISHGKMHPPKDHVHVQDGKNEEAATKQRVELHTPSMNLQQYIGRTSAAKKPGDDDRFDPMMEELSKP